MPYWGLGWAIDATASGDCVYHSGSNGTGFRCYCEFDRKSCSGLVIMTNAVGGEDLWKAVVAAVENTTPTTPAGATSSQPVP